jgi:phenylacetate-CoA ligase
MFIVPRLVADVMQRQGLERPFRLVVERLEGSRDELSLEIAGEPFPDPTEFQAEVESALRIRLALKFVESLPDGGPRLLDRRFAIGG